MPSNSKEYAKNYYLLNKDKFKEYQKKQTVHQKRKNKVSAVSTRYQRLYGISLEEYNLILKEQNNVCKICKKAEQHRRLAVDHCHKTKKVRGLLCVKCNRGIGNFNDNPSLLYKAFEYLKEN